MIGHQLELHFYGRYFRGPDRPTCDGCQGRTAAEALGLLTLVQDPATGAWYCDPCALARGLLDGAPRAQAPPG